MGLMACVVVIASGTLAGVMKQRQASRLAAEQRLQAQRAAAGRQSPQPAPRLWAPASEPPAPQPLPVQESLAPVVRTPPVPTTTPAVKTPAVVGQTPPPPSPPVPSPGGKTIQDPLAREALALVGADPLAERVWAEAINNPALAPNERKDLIEDLNEDGFPDPHHVTPDDLPLIWSRIELIERYGPESMDEVNVEAFLEAYKDLWNMITRLAQQ